VSTVFTHAFVAVAGARIATARPMPRRYWIAAVVLSALPDADYLGHALGVPYAHVLGHRGLSHSLLFAFLAALGTTLLFFRERRVLVGATFFLLAASHGVLDAMTDAGLGIAFLAPFDDTRFFLPVRPLPTPALSVSAFFGARGVLILGHEVARVWLPAAVLCLVVEVLRTRPGRAACP